MTPMGQFLGTLHQQDGIHLLASRAYAFDEREYDVQYGYDRSTIDALMVSIQHLFRQSGFVPGGRCLDIGCGTGVLTAALANTGWFDELILTDPSVTFLKISRKRMQHAAPRAKATYIAMGGDEIGQLPAGTFGVIAVRYALHHIYDWRRFLREAHQALAPGGILLLEEPFAEGYLMQAALAAHHYQPKLDSSWKGKGQCEAWWLLYLKNSVQSYLVDGPQKLKMEDKHLFLAHEIMSEASDLEMRFKFYPNSGFDSFDQSGRKRDDFLQSLLHNARVNLGFPEEVVTQLAQQFVEAGSYIKSVSAARDCLFSRGLFLLRKE